MKFSGCVCMFVKLHRPPPEIRIFSPMLGIVLEHKDGPAAPARFDRAHQARCTAANDDDITSTTSMELLRHHI